MFKKILMVEDHESALSAPRDIAKDLGVLVIDEALYCEDALLKIKRANINKTPYELLITDLSFDSDENRKDKISGGAELIQLIRKEQPTIKVIVFSSEHRPNRIKNLINNYAINAFVSKGREDRRELKNAFKAVYNNSNYFSQDIKATSSKNVYEPTDYEIKLLQLLSEGLFQKEISAYFTRKNIVPYSESAIEKKLANLRDIYNANNTVHLLSIAKDIGLI